MNNYSKRKLTSAFKTHDTRVSAELSNIRENTTGDIQEHRRAIKGYMNMLQAETAYLMDVLAEVDKEEEREAHREFSKRFAKGMCGTASVTKVGG